MVLQTRVGREGPANFVVPPQEEMMREIRKAGWHANKQAAAAAAAFVLKEAPRNFANVHERENNMCC